MNRSFERIGLTIATVLGLLGLAGLAGLLVDPAPPAAMAITGAVLGLLTLAAIRPARDGNAIATITVIATRLVSALLSLPVFFVDDAPGWARTVVPVLLALTVAAVVLVGLGRVARSSTR